MEMVLPGADNAAVESSGDLVVVQSGEGTYRYTLRAVNARRKQLSNKAGYLP